MRAGERIAVRTRRTSSAQILIGQYGAPGRTEDIEYGSWVGQFIIGFKLDTGATEIALIAFRTCRTSARDALPAEKLCFVRIGGRIAL